MLYKKSNERVVRQIFGSQYILELKIMNIVELKIMKLVEAVKFLSPYRTG